MALYRDKPRKKLTAQFFVDSFGVITKKAVGLKKKQRQKIYERDGYICAICTDELLLPSECDWYGRSDIKKAATIDHIIPLTRGGQNNPENLRVLCFSCNARKKSW